MKIKEICEKTGLTERAVRLYLERGLLHPASERRRGRTYYEYSEADLARLREIAALRGRGFSLEEIALLLDAGDADAILASRIAALKEEAGQAAENADALGQLAGKGWPDGVSLAQAVLRQGCPKVPADAEPDFGREDGLTREEKRRLSQNARKNLGRASLRKRILAGAAAAVLLIAGALGWRHWQGSRPVSALTLLSPAVFTDKQLLRSEDGKVLLTARCRTEEGEFLAVFRGETGDALYESLFLGQEYAAVTVQVELPRREAEKRGLLDGDFLRMPWEQALPDDSFCLEYLSVFSLQGEYGGS